MRRHASPLLGVAYVLLVILLVATSVMTFRKSLPWQRAAGVTLRTNAAGLELNPLSDVKLQGVRVGEVRSIRSDGRSATIHLAIDNDKLNLIPADVDAAIIPKTLFGEKFVDLRPAGAAYAGTLADGDVIRQSRTSAEIGAIFSKLVPLLRALKPEQLSVTLTSLEEALDGRGTTVARDLRQLQEVMDAVGPHLDTFTHDVDQFTKTADIYADATPDLLRVLKSSTRISDDLLEPKEKRLESFLDQMDQTSKDATAVLQTNRRNLAALADRSRPVLGLLDEYSSMLPCTLRGLHTFDTLGNQSTGARGPFINLILDIISARKPYTYPADLPSNPNSDANDHQLPTGVPNWKPHCPEFAPSVLALKDAAPYSMLLPGVALEPRIGGNGSPRSTSSASAADSAAPPESELRENPAELNQELSKLLVDPVSRRGAR